ncbi:MAG: class I adenylate-forming enzyme family protein [Hyphomicrobiales bacterium]
MILVTEEQRQTYINSGLWGENSETHSLDSILRTNAREKADTLAFCDAPNRSQWTSGETKSLTWGALNKEVDILATFIKGLGLAKDAVVALYGPNTVNMAVSILAINRAGLIAAPIPLFWRQAEMQDYLSEIHARAMITVDRVENDSPALRCRDLTQHLFSMKYVLAFGYALPDGVVSLDKILPSVSEMMESEPVFDVIHPDAIISLHPTSLQSRDTEIAIPRTSNQWLSTERAIFDVIEETTNTLLPFALSGLIGFCAGIVRTLTQKGAVNFHHFQTDNMLAGHLDLVKPDLVLLPQHCVAQQMNRFSANQKVTIGCVWKNNHLAQMPVEQSDSGNQLFDVSILNEIVALGQLRTPGQHTPSSLPLTEDVRDLSLRLKKSTNTKLKQSTKLAGGELIATGASAPEALFPSNSEKRALSRLRNKTVYAGACTHVACRLNENDPTQCEPIGFLIDTIQRSNQLAVAGELDDLYKSVANIIDAAHFIDPITDELNVAVVTRDLTLSIETFSNQLSEMGVSHLKIPVALYPINEIKRGVGGVVMRHELVELIEENKSRKLMEDRQQVAI